MGICVQEMLLAEIKFFLVLGFLLEQIRADFLHLLV